MIEQGKDYSKIQYLLYVSGEWEPVKRPEYE